MLYYQGDGYLWQHCWWTLYTSHIDHFTPHHTAFEQSTECLSVFLESLPGFIPFAILWHAGWTLEKNICMSINCNNLTTIFRCILTQIECISVIIYIFFHFDFEKFKTKNCKYIFFYKKMYILRENTSKYCSWIIVVHIHATVAVRWGVKWSMWDV